MPFPKAPLQISWQPDETLERPNLSNPRPSNLLFQSPTQWDSRGSQKILKCLLRYQDVLAVNAPRSIILVPAGDDWKWRKLLTSLRACLVGGVRWTCSLNIWELLIEVCSDVVEWAVAIRRMPRELAEAVREHEEKFRRNNSVRWRERNESAC